MHTFSDFRFSVPSRCFFHCDNDVYLCSNVKFQLEDFSLPQPRQHAYLQLFFYFIRLFFRNFLDFYTQFLYAIFTRNNSSVVPDSEKTNSSYVMVIPKYGLSLYDFMYERQETLSFDEARRTYKKILKALCKLRQVFTFR